MTHCLQIGNDLKKLELTGGGCASRPLPGAPTSGTPGTADASRYAAQINSRWRVEDIHFAPSTGRMLTTDPALLLLVVASSLTESASDLYTRNLLDYFAGDAELSAWLTNFWEPEELQHGRALRTYVAHAWPEFDWACAFKGFLNEYAPLCRVDVLGPTPVLELVSRCVVETGTSTLYRAIRDATDDPVLREIANQIQHDEVQHFKHFFRSFRRYSGTAPPGRWAVLKTIAARTLEIRDSDSMCALRHIIDGCANVGATDKHTLLDTKAMFRATQQRLTQHYPFEAAAKMILTPLMLPPKTKVAASLTLGSVARLLAT